MSDLPITRFNDHFAVAPQLAPEDMARLAEAGFKSVINNRPDGEGGPAQPLSADIEQAARAAGLEYRYQPVNGAAIQAQDVVTFGELVKSLPGPVLAFCRSGTRSGNLYRAAGTL
ncbi:TIGR01244 family phosphatase [Verticiella sediminum]|uniref:TIGR01244 family phosphatase n=1 Tax=Verticiella sediminum TaxID=1247510 RepID=A0A556AIL7_9BURK|nr:TIGR01244 family sulfur transferase [Verticiella sediminum]TSH92720.1 TIGR01244 family phosphatase [Verticiella sediminum]